MIEIPKGTSKEDILIRKQIIFEFYQSWKLEHPDLKMYNRSLREYINIRYVSIDETYAHASKNYLSTLAVLQLDAILTLAKKKSVTIAKSTSKNQKPFEKMITMTYDCPGIGDVKLTVGVRKVTHEKVQYCITALNVKKKHPEGCLDYCPKMRGEFLPDGEISRARTYARNDYPFLITTYI